MQPRDEFIQDVLDGVTTATMAIRMTLVSPAPCCEFGKPCSLTNTADSPYILSRVNWQDPRHDPIVRQFLPLKSVMIPDHPKLVLDSLHEEADSPVKGLVHRYPDKALFLRMFSWWLDVLDRRPRC